MTRLATITRFPMLETVANLIMEDVKERSLATSEITLRFWKYYVDDTCAVLLASRVQVFLTTSTELNPAYSVLSTLIYIHCACIEYTSFGHNADLLAQHRFKEVMQFYYSNVICCKGYKNAHLQMEFTNNDNVMTNK